MKSDLLISTRYARVNGAEPAKIKSGPIEFAAELRLTHPRVPFGSTLRTALSAFRMLVLPAVAIASVAGRADAATAPVPPAFAVCAACHSVEPGKTRIGPSLAGVAGRKAGSLSGFTYSTAMRTSDLTWDAASLDRFITAPSVAVPGTRMAFAGVKDAQRRSEIIAFLLTLTP